jgi:hypothetical protein
LLQIASRIRKAREELSKAEDELERLLEDSAGEPAVFDVSKLSGEVAETVADLTSRGVVPPRVLRGEGAAEWAGVPVLRTALVAATAQTLARSASRKRPSTAARILAILMEEPAREFKASQVARRSGCSEGVARTTLNRLVVQGHASRTGSGLFRAA